MVRNTGNKDTGNRNTGNKDMDNNISNDMIKALTTPQMISKGELIERLVAQMKASADLLNNALENDKVLVVGREAGRIAENADLVLKLLNS